MKQQSLLILTSLLLSAGLLGGCTPIVSTQPPQATAATSQAAAEPIYTVTPQTNTPASPTTATAALSLTASPTITNSVTSPPTNTATPKATITPAIMTLPLTSDTLTPVSAEQTPWLDWAEQYLSVDTVCAPHSADLSLAAFRGDGFHVYDPRTNELKWTYEMPVEPVGGGPIVFSPDNQFVAHGGSDKMLHIWDAETGELLYEFSYAFELYDLMFSGDGEWVIVRGGEFSAVLEATNVFTGKRVEFPVQEPRSDMAPMPGSSEVIVFLDNTVDNGEQRILKWNLVDNSVETFIPLGSDLWAYRFADGTRAYYSASIDVSPDRSLLSAIVYEGSKINLYLWNIPEQKWISIEDNNIGRTYPLINEVMHAPDSSFLVLHFWTRAGAQLRIWNRTGEFIGDITMPENHVSRIDCPFQDPESGYNFVDGLTSLMFTPDNGYLATFGYLPDGTKDVLLWPLPR